MNRPNGKRRRVVPQPGGESFQLGETVGEPTFHMPMPAQATHVVPVALDTWQIGEAAPAAERGHPSRPLVPASEDVAKLPRGAREAFAARCAARVARLRAGATTPEAAAALILAAAAVNTPLRRHLLRIRRDFDRLAYLAKKHHWADDTPVPQDVFGPMWHPDFTPDWAKEPPGK